MANVGWGQMWGKFWGGKISPEPPPETFPESPGYGRPGIYVVEREEGDMTEFPPRGTSK